jgi:hypothetical protein
MRTAPMLVALIVGAVLTASAPGAGAAKDPLSLVLQRADFPAKTKLTSARYPSIDKALAAAGLQGKSADCLAEIPRGGTEALLVSGRVVVFPNTAQASRMFAQYKRDLALDLKLARTVRLPAYGDEQSAFFQTKPGVRGDIRARFGAVVWRVEIRWVGTEKHTRAQTLAELKTYATKLKRRVGNG